MKVRTCLLHNQLDVIVDKGHLGCGFIDQEFFLKLLGYSQPAQSAFAIQVKGIKPFSVGISKSLLSAREDIYEYTIQLPTSMARVDESITTPLHAHVVFVIRKGFPSSNKQETADTLTKALLQNASSDIASPCVVSNPICHSRECEVYCTTALTLMPSLESGLSSQSKSPARVFRAVSLLRFHVTRT